jgi:membrane protein implicated in regulation of membrane protease activity
MPDFYTWIAWAIAVLAFVVGVQVLGPLLLLAVLLVGALLLIVASYSLGRRARRHMRQVDARFQPTDEVFRDPSSGRLTRVHVDPETGERRYLWDK